MRLANEILDNDWIDIHIGISGGLCMIEKPKVIGRTFWDFCCQRPFYLLIILLVICLTTYGIGILASGRDIDWKFYIGPQVNES